jgi:hypothetical protein
VRAEFALRARVAGRKSSSFDTLRMRILCAPKPTVVLTLSLSKGEGGSRHEAGGVLDGAFSGL